MLDHVRLICGRQTQGSLLVLGLYAADSLLFSFLRALLLLLFCELILTCSCCPTLDGGMSLPLNLALEEGRVHTVGVQGRPWLPETSVLWPGKGTWEKAP